MKCLLLQKIQQGVCGWLLIGHRLLSISIIFSLFSMPVYAQSNYLFPSDIIDQAEQSHYDIGRESRYETNKQWVYPNASQFNNNKHTYSGSSQKFRANYHDIPELNASTHEKNHYQSSQYQRENIQSFNNKLGSGVDWYSESERYKYGDFKSDPARPSPVQPSFSNQKYLSQRIGQQPEFSAGARYPGDNRNHLYAAYDVQNRHQTSYRKQFNNMGYEKKSLPHSDFLYPGDLDENQWSKRKGSYNSNPFNFNSFDSYPDTTQEGDYNRQKVQIQYIPVPVYSIPGTLPGTVPGVVTPGNMVPGYSHLSPNSNYDFFHQGNTNNSLLYQSLNQGLLKQRINPKLMQQRIPGSNLLNRNSYNDSRITPLMGSPFKGMGAFPGGTSPFDTFYKSYDNHSPMTKPFSSPDSMIPGISMPSMFSSQ